VYGVCLILGGAVDFLGETVGLGGAADLGKAADFGWSSASALH
jgi:hypothetical protein